MAMSITLLADLANLFDSSDTDGAPLHDALTGLVTDLHTALPSYCDCSCGSLITAGR